MRNKKVINIVKVTLGNLILVGLLSGCGSMADLDTSEKENLEVVESSIVKEPETSVTEQVEDKEAATELIVETESETTTDRNFKIEINSGSYTAEAKEYEEIFITYEDMEPVTMYAITYSEIYPDLNASEGVLRVDGCVEAGDEVLIDGKGIFDDVEYYRIKRPENCFNPYSSIIPADALSFEKPVQSPIVEQSVETTIIIEAAPAEEKRSLEELVGADTYASLSEEHKKNLELIFNCDGQIAWAEDPNADIPGFSCERNENGGFTIIDPTLTPEQLERIGRLIVY
ncbi:MAG: hypothetical protein E7293_05435 [Lachnospiraceae bacterium]|nr:hypothetical protein [Lachnospiraceae bacterium]